MNGYVARASVAPHLPAVILLRSLNNPNIAITFVGKTTVSGRAAIVVKLSDESSPVLGILTTQLWSFDAATGIPLRLDYQLPDNKRTLDLTDAALEFSDFRLISGVAVPFQVATTFDGRPFSTIKLTTVTFNSGVAAEEFVAPVGGVQ
jgi:hypothetical protein